MLQSLRLWRCEAVTATRRPSCNSATTARSAHRARILRDDGVAEEAVQDTWLRAFTTSHAYRGEASLGTWLARIADQ